MCGLAAVARVGADLPVGTGTVLGNMAKAVGHRGPDAEQFFLDGPVGLGFRRLALVGPDSGDQPLFSSGKQIVLIANGEVYNHRELERRNGMRLRTSSDCEVLAHLYARDGVDFLRDVVGMFAIILWDKRTNRLVLARDRFGIKPLYYTRTNGMVLVASEIKALFQHPDCRRELDWHSTLADQSVNGAPYLTSAPINTWFRDIESVPAGGLVVIDLNTGETRQHSYWRLPTFDGDLDLSNEEFISRYRDLLGSAVSDAATADAELGMFLSGGIDSAAVAALAAAQGKNLHTFTVLSGSTLTNGDAEFGHRVARSLGLPNHQLFFDADAVPGVDQWKRLLWLLETPLCGPEQFYKYELYRYAKQVRPELRGMLLGAGSDEYNGGFSTLLCLEPDWPGFEAGIQQMARASALHRQPGLTRWWDYPEGALLTDDLLLGPARDILEDAYSAYVSWRHRHMQQYNCWHEDRTAAGNGVEARVPFLDHRIIELLAGIPAQRRAELLWDKRILRDGFRDLLEPAVTGRPKVPFYYGDGAGFTHRTMVRMLAQDGDALLEEALAAPGARDLLSPQGLRTMLRRLETEPEPWDVEFMLRLVNVGLLDQMVRELPAVPLDAPSYRVLSALAVADWDRDAPAVMRQLRHRPQPTPESVIDLAPEVLLVQTPDDPDRLFIALNGTFEFVAERDEDAAWWAFLREVDGKRPVAEILDVCGGVEFAAVEKTLSDALDAGVLKMVGT
ncbi:asparagine synthase (glutamine-hydrolyzing) [Micromonospora luteifusca]|nr:asparagine synthase (glutamine-hydrolyzing) [Micromonospora luteifusca]